MGRLLLTIAGNSPVNAPCEMFDKVAMSLNSNSESMNKLVVGTWCCVINCEDNTFKNKEVTLKSYLNLEKAYKKLRVYSYVYENTSI